MNQMTTKKISQKRNDRIQLLSPIHFKLESELLSPIIRQTYNILLRTNKLPELPKKLHNEQFNVKYTSPLALTQQTSESKNIQQTISMITPYAQTDPNILQNYNTNYITQKIWNMHNNNPHGLRPKKKIESDRQQQAQQQQTTINSKNTMTTSTTIHNTSSILGQINK